MPISTGAALLIGGGVSAAGGVASSLIGANAAGKAASTQAAASEEAAQLQFEEAQQALAFQEQQYANALGLEEPAYLSGNAAMGTLDQLLGLPSFPANTSIFSNPFGMSGAPTGVNPNGTVPGSSVPLSPLLPSTGAPSSVTQGPLAVAKTGAGAQQLTPQQGAAAIEGFGSPNPRFNPNAPGIIGPVGIQQTSLPSGGGLAPGSSGAGMPAGSPSPGMVPLSSLAGTVGNTGLPAGFLAQTWDTPFVAPTAEEAAQMPGYQFQLQQGEQAIQNSAAARGGLLSGGTAKALDQYSQGLASTDYQQLYNQALTQYQQAYNIFNQNQANIFNRYADLAGMGQVSAQQLANAGLSTGSNVANTLLTSGAQLGQDLNNAAAARASGYVGAANAFGGALGSLGSLGSLIPLYSLLGNQGMLSTNSPGVSVVPGGAGPGTTVIE